MAVFLEWIRPARWLFRSFIAALILIFLFDVYFIPSSNWYHKDFYMRSTFSPKAAARYLDEFNAIRPTIRHFNAVHPGEPLLLLNDNDIADTRGPAYENHWHQYNIVVPLQRATRVADVLRLVNQREIRYLIARKPNAWEHAEPEALRKFLAVCTIPEYELDKFFLAHIDPGCVEEHVQSRPEVALPAGLYDDFDPAIWYRGAWTHSSAFDGPVSHTVSFSDEPGAEVVVSFEGHAVNLSYTSAPNRGIASVTVDGVPQADIDGYSKEVQWQRQVRYCCFGPGRHELVIRVAGRHSPGSTGDFIDFDAITVE